MFKAILFDFDGTIIDSNRVTIASLKRSFHHFRFPIPSQKAFEASFGFKIPDVLKQLQPQLSGSQLLSLFEYYKKISSRSLNQITIIPGAIEALATLQKMFRLGVVTSRSKESVETLLTMHNLDKYFSVVYDREDVTKHKPDPEGIFLAMKQLSVTSSEVMYIGDAAVDIETAHNAGILCIIISSLPLNGADYTIDTIRQLSDLVHENF